jgi:hypothetical protein
VTMVSEEPHVVNPTEERLLYFILKVYALSFCQKGKVSFL